MCIPLLVIAAALLTSGARDASQRKGSINQVLILQGKGGTFGCRFRLE
jgi:hypothetical protein